MKLFTIYGSSRRNGNTEELTKIVLNGLEPGDYKQVFLLDYDIKPIVDERHTDQGFQTVDDNYDSLAAQMLKYEAILFVTPLYWYGMSGRLKNFIDRWSQSIRNDDLHFKEQMKGKKVYVLTVGGRKAPITALPLIQQFQLICEFLEMDFAGYVIGRGVKPLDVLEDEESIHSAKHLGIKIKLDLE